jgi:hypothetical protein
MTYITREQRVAAEGTALALVVGVQDDEYIFKRHHDRQRPDLKQG